MNIISQINELLKIKFKEMGYDESMACISVSNKLEFADFQINSCFNIAKALKKNPMDITLNIVKSISDISLNNKRVFSACEASKPGFVNLKLNDEILYDFAISLMNDDNLGIDTSFMKDIPKCILLDYGGANVAKPLHVGHLRVAVIGEALKRLYNRFSIKTISDVHLGDFGLQMGLVIEELKDEGKVDSFTTEDLELVYPKASLRAKDDKEFSDRAHLATKKLQDDVEPETSIWKKILKISIDDLKVRYATLNVFFDYYYGESTVKDIMESMVDEMIKKGIAYESDGAYVVDVKEDTDKKEMPPCIVRKSDGAVLYATSDLATIEFREENFDVDRYVYVVDKRQSLHLESCFRASKKAGLLKRNKEFYHVAVGTMNGIDGKPFKSRDGGVVKLETLISEAKEKAMLELKSNERDLTGFDADDIAKKIAISALKYGDLSNSPTRDYIFDMNKFLSFQGNTGPYILYTIVRIKSIFDKLSDKDVDLNSVIYDDKLIDDIVHNIFLKLIKYNDALILAYKNYDPSEICKYIYELSNDFNTFYHGHNIINETDINKKRFYIVLLRLIDKILRDALSILAIDIPDKM